MHAKTLEALLCLSSPIMTDKFIQIYFLPTPFCQHRWSWRKSVRKRRGGESFCLKVSLPMLQIHKYQNTWGQLTNYIRDSPAINPHSQPKKSLVLFENTKC